MTADDLIRMFGLHPLPWEGGYYRETWRSAVEVPEGALALTYGGPRSAGTAIYYLLTPDTASKMHRLPSDEIFHFYLGDAVELLLLHPSGEGETVRLGQAIMAGELVQSTVPGMTWMGARLLSAGVHGYALMGTTVSPGFDFADLEMGDAGVLMAAYPQYADFLATLS